MKINSWLICDAHTYTHKVNKKVGGFNIHHGAIGRGEEKKKFDIIPSAHAKKAVPPTPLTHRSSCRDAIDVHHRKLTPPKKCPPDRVSHFSVNRT